jgi:hypothetical protein
MFQVLRISTHGICHSMRQSGCFVAFGKLLTMLAYWTQAAAARAIAWGATISTDARDPLDLP